MEENEISQDTPIEEPVVEDGDLQETPDETLIGGPGLEPTEEPQFTPKHKTWEETEKARQEAEKMGHTAKTEAAKLRKQVETHEQTLKSMKGGQEPDKPKADTPRSKILREVNTKIKQLDQRLASGEINQEQHTEAVMDAWAEANENLADARVQVRLSEHDSTTKKISGAEQKVKDAGLSLMIKAEDGSENDAGLSAFWAIANSGMVPPDLTIEQEVDFCIDQVKQYNDAIVERFKTDQKGGGFPKPLGKGGKVPRVQEEEEFPATMGDAFKKDKEERRIKN